MELFLVRHAKAVARSDWSGRDVDRPLDARGFVQAPLIAEAIAADLAGRTPRLVSSPSLRCRQTLAPLSELCEVEVESDPLLGDLDSGVVEPGHTKKSVAPFLADNAMSWIQKAVAASPTAPVVACSHGDLLPEVVSRLVDGSGIQTEGWGNHKGSWWRLTFKDARLRRAVHFPAP